jgi:hypothetical protein
MPGLDTASRVYPTCGAPPTVSKHVPPSHELEGCDCLAASALPACAMLLPSGRANTRCSVCGSDPGRCSFITQAGARNGFAEPRDRAPNSGLSRPQPAAETASLPFEPAKMPANCGLFGRDRKTAVRIAFRELFRPGDRYVEAFEHQELGEVAARWPAARSPSRHFPRSCVGKGNRAALGFGQFPHLDCPHLLRPSSFAAAIAH